MPEAVSIIRSTSSEVLWPPPGVFLLGCGFRLHVPQGLPQRRRHLFDQLRVCPNAERARVHHEAIDGLSRELARLAQTELVTVRLSGNQKHYQANPQSPIYAELCGIAQKTIGLAEPLRTSLAPLASRIHAAFVYGSVAKRQDTASSDVDLMLISDDVNYGELFATLEELGRKRPGKSC